MYLIRYDEIMLKGKNRRTFEWALMRRINEKIKQYAQSTDQTINPVRKWFGKLLLEVGTQDEAIDEILSLTPWIVYFAFVHTLPKDIETIGQAILEHFPADTLSFKIETKRADKSFPIRSTELNQQLGGVVIDHFGTAVDLKHPATTVYVTIDDTAAYLYLQKKPWLGGLPVSSGGRVISLLSGGIDSPVASAMMMTRGLVTSV